MSILIVSGTGTGVGKTVVTAALAASAAAAGHTVAVLKPAQTGVAEAEPGDVAEVLRLAGPTIAGVELARFPEPLAPATAARRARAEPVRPEAVAEAALKLAASYDLVLIEGAGGLLVRYDEEGATLADAARLIGCPVLIVASAGLGTLNTTALTAEALRSRDLPCLGVVVGSWPRGAELADRCNLTDLPEVAQVPLLGAVPEHAAALTPAGFQERAAGWLAPALHGTFDARRFQNLHTPGPLA